MTTNKEVADDNVHHLSKKTPREKNSGGMINNGNKHVDVGPGGHQTVDDGLDDEE